MNFIHLHRNHQTLKMLNLDQVRSISIRKTTLDTESEEANIKAEVTCWVEFDGVDETEMFSVIFVNEEKENYVTEAKGAVYNCIANAVWNGKNYINVVIEKGLLTF